MKTKACIGEERGRTDSTCGHGLFRKVVERKKVLRVVERARKRHELVFETSTGGGGGGTFRTDFAAATEVPVYNNTGRKKIVQVACLANTLEEKAYPLLTFPSPLTIVSSRKDYAWYRRVSQE